MIPIHEITISEGSVDWIVFTENGDWRMEKVIHFHTLE